MSTGRSIFTRPDQSVWQPFLAIGEARPKYRWRSFRNCSRSTRWKGSSPACEPDFSLHGKRSRTSTPHRGSSAPATSCGQPVSANSVPRPARQPISSPATGQDRQSGRTWPDEQTDRHRAPPLAADRVHSPVPDLPQAPRYDQGGPARRPLSTGPARIADSRGTSAVVTLRLTAETQQTGGAERDSPRG